MNLKKTTLIFLLIFTFSCQSAKKSAPNLVDLPSWYLSPSQNNENQLYGVGEGFTLEEATKSALSDASARLAVSISSTSTLLREENNNASSEEIRQNISQNIEKIDFANFEVSKSKKLGAKIYVEVIIDRAKFVNLQKEKIGFLDNQISNLQNNLDKQNLIQKRISLGKVVDLGSQSEILTRIIYSDNGEFLKKKLRIISDAKNQLANLNNKFEFYFVNNSSPKIYEIIKNALNKEGIAIAVREKPSQNQIKIVIKSSHSTGEVYGAYITKIKVNFNNMAEGKIIASNSVEISGSSSISAIESYSAAIESLKDVIKKDGVLKVLGAV